MTADLEQLVLVLFASGYTITVFWGFLTENDFFLNYHALRILKDTVWKLVLCHFDLQMFTPNLQFFSQR